MDVVDDLGSLSFAVLSLVSTLRVRVVHLLGLFENVLRNVSTTRIRASNCHAWRVSVQQLIPLVRKALFMNHEQRFFPDLFDD